MSGRRLPRPVVAVIVLAVAGAALWFGFLRNDSVENGLTAAGTVEATEGQLAFRRRVG